MGGDDRLPTRTRPKRRKISWHKKEHSTAHKSRAPRKLSKCLSTKKLKAPKFLTQKNSAVQNAPVLRKKVNPETAKYFSEIANLFAKGEVDIEERPIICNNALEETRGIEFEIATDKIISSTLQTLLEGCDIFQLCYFMRSCTKTFLLIAMDKSGSHVVETALKSLAVHLQDRENYTIIKETVTKICQVVTVKPVDLMCSPYGSHVLRSLLCLCKGIPLDSLQDFHSTRTSTILVGRLKTRFTTSDGIQPEHLQHGFPELLHSMVRGMLHQSKNDTSILRVSNYGSLVLQVALRLLKGEVEEISQMVYILLGCRDESSEDGKFIENLNVKEFRELLKDTAFSHLMEVILEVSPETLFNELFTNIFRKSLFELSQHFCSSFVIQALLSSACSHIQMEFIWEELGVRIKELLELGRFGVIASLLAACQRLHLYENKSIQLLAEAVCVECGNLVPHILFLDNYFSCKDKSSWKWPKGDKMHTLGCLMLQIIFKYPRGIVQQYCKSVSSMEADQILETGKDAGGSRVIECFLSSDASTKQKHKVISKLKGCFGELSLHPAGSFIIEKCFTAGNLLQKDVIASELVTAQPDLSKTRHGPYLIKKLDLNGYATHPEQWRSRQASRQAAFQEFVSAFNSNQAGLHAETQFNTPDRKLIKGQKQEGNLLLHNSISGTGFRSVKCAKREVCNEARHPSSQLPENRNHVPFISGKGKRGFSIHDKRNRPTLGYRLCA